MSKKLLTNIYVFAISLFLGEVFIFASPLKLGVIFNSFSQTALFNNLKFFPIFFSFIFLLLVTYVLFKLVATLIKIIKTKRWDVLATICVTITCIVFFEKIRLTETFDSYELFFIKHKEQLIIFAPAVLSILFAGVTLVLLNIFWKDIKPLFIKKISDFFSIQQKGLEDIEVSFSDSLNDDPWSPEKEDLLGYLSLASKFSKKVLEGTSKTSIVFGLEAPWGAGKTSFLEMCRINWLKESKKLLVINFNPWHFDTETDLIKKYFDQLKKSVQESYFCPELNRSINEYIKLISSVNLKWLNLKPLKSSEDIKKIHDNIGESLKKLGITIIVVIDDLDRIPLDKARQILKLVALCADFPNTRYILCYDLENLYSADTYTVIDKTKGTMSLNSENLNQNSGILQENVNLKTSQQIDSSPLQSYLEKIVNIKYILPYYQKEKIIGYLVDSLYTAFFELKKNEDTLPDIIPVTKQKLQEAIGGLFDDNAYISRKYVFSLRQAKSIIKTFLSAQEDNPRFFVYDIRKVEDLILLIILKYHFPKVYADICYYEYNQGFKFIYQNSKYRFTANRELGDKKSKPGYKIYVSDNGLDSAVSDILSLIFDGNTHFSSEYLTNYDLNQYIKFIEGIEDPQLTNSVFIEFFKNLNKESKTILADFDSYIVKIIKGINGSDLAEVIKKNFILKQFFQKITEKIYEINKINDALDVRLIDEAISMLPQYSLHESENIAGIRDILDSVIIKILNDGVWNKNGAGHNTIANIKTIAPFLLGAGSSKSVFQKVGEDRGPIGIYEIVKMKFSCNSSRGGLWEISRSLLWHKLSENGTKEVEDSVINQNNDLIGMEEVSLHVFSVFKKEYIDKNRNFLLEIENIQPEDILGSQVSGNLSWLNEVKAEKNFEQQTGVIKARIEMFVLYDFSFEGYHGGMRAGGYIHKGKKIKDYMQEYLFEKCFIDVANQNKAYECFVNLLLRNFESIRSFDSDLEYQFNFDTTTKILDSEKLLSYWEKHRDAIKTMYKNKTGTFWAGGYKIFFTDEPESMNDLTNKKRTGIFDVLDEKLTLRSSLEV